MVPDAGEDAAAGGRILTAGDRALYEEARIYGIYGDRDLRFTVTVDLRSIYAIYGDSAHN